MEVKRPSTLLDGSVQVISGKRDILFLVEEKMEEIGALQTFPWRRWGLCDIGPILEPLFMVYN